MGNDPNRANLLAKWTKMAQFASKFAKYGSFPILYYSILLGLEVHSTGMVSSQIPWFPDSVAPEPEQNNFRTQSTSIWVF